MMAEIYDTIKTVAAVTGVILPLGGIYVASGLPIPATTSQLEAKIEPIRYGLTNLEIVVLQQQRESIRARRNFLRQDKYALLSKGDASKLNPTDQARLAEIEDSMKETEGRDVAIEKRIQELSAKPWDERLQQLKSVEKK